MCAVGALPSVPGVVGVVSVNAAVGCNFTLTKNEAYNSDFE